MKYWPTVEACIPDLPKLSVGKRNIVFVVLHHTYQPDHARWAGRRSVEAMLRFWGLRQKQEGWQAPPGGHFVISPTGEVYAPFGDLSLPLNANSNIVANRRGIAIEVVGNFDVGKDSFDGAQKHATIGLMAALLRQFGLPEASLFFHRDYLGPNNSKTCPGTALDRRQVRAQVAAAASWARRIARGEA